MQLHYIIKNYTTEHYWQLGLISAGGAARGKRKIYYSAEAALKTWLEWGAWES